MSGLSTGGCFGDWGLTIYPPGRDGVNLHVKRARFSKVLETFHGAKPIFD